MGTQLALKPGKGKTTVPMSLRLSFPSLMSSVRCVYEVFKIKVAPVPFASPLFNQTVSFLNSKVSYIVFIYIVDIAEEIDIRCNLRLEQLRFADILAIVH